MRILHTSRRIPGRSPASVLFWWVLVSSVVHLLLLTLYGLRRYGKENVTRHGPAIYVANHQSLLDPPVVGVLVADRPFSSLARSGLFHNRVFAWIIRQLGAIPIEQGKGDTGAMRAALRELEEGRRVLIFPEGSRSPDGALDEFQRGVMLLIKRAMVPIIPIAVEGAYDVWPTHRKRPRLTGRIAVKANPPIDPNDLLRDGPEAALHRLRREIETMRMQLREELRRRTGGRYPARGPGDQPYWLRKSSRDGDEG